MTAPNAMRDLRGNPVILRGCTVRGLGRGERGGFGRRHGTDRFGLRFHCRSRCIGSLRNGARRVAFAQSPNQISTGAIALIRNLGQRFGNWVAVTWRKLVELRGGLQMLHDELADARTRKWPMSSQQLLVNDGEAVLIA